MTVAAIILPASLEEALADTAGRSAARRVVESAWAGGATPIIVVCRDEGGRLALALAGSPAVLAEPAPSGGTSGQLVRGARLAAERVNETDALLAWPGSMGWVDPETVTSLIEAHGTRRDSVLRPSYAGTPGWPVLIPLDRVEGLAGTPAAATAELEQLLLSNDWRPELLDTGDPGTVFDLATHIDELPDYSGPPEPVAGPPPEWGAPAADTSDEGPLAGPALAPYSQAAEEGE